jgi:hypothetical protein
VYQSRTPPAQEVLRNGKRRSGIVIEHSIRETLVDSKISWHNTSMLTNSTQMKIADVLGGGRGGQYSENGNFGDEYEGFPLKMNLLELFGGPWAPPR